MFRSKNGCVLQQDGRTRFSIIENTVQLALDNVHKDDAAFYTITAKSPLGSSSKEVELRVSRATVDGSMENESPAFLRRLNDLSVTVGTRTRFLIEIRSSSSITVRHREGLCYVGTSFVFVARMVPQQSEDNTWGAVS